MKKLFCLLLGLMLLCACAPAAPQTAAEPTAVPAAASTPAPSPKATPIAVTEGENADVFLVYNGKHYGMVNSNGVILRQFIYSDIRRLSGERLILTIENADGLPLHALALLSGELLSEHIYSEIIELGNGMGRAKCRETGETHLIGLDTGLVLCVLPAHLELAGISPTAATMLVVDTQSAQAVCYSLADALRGEFTELARFDEAEVDHCCRYWPETGLGAFCLADGMLLFGAGNEPLYADSIEPSYGSEFIRFCERGKFGYCDLSATVVIPRKYRESGDFCDGLAWAKDEKKYGYIDSSGEFVIEAEYTSCSDFFHGYAYVTRSDGSGLLIDVSGKEVVSSVTRMLTYTAENGSWLVIAVTPAGSTLIRRDSILRYEGLLACKEILFTTDNLCALMLETPDSDAGYPLLLDMDTGAILQSGSSYTAFALVPEPISETECDSFTGTRHDGKLDVFSADGSVILSGVDRVLGVGQHGFSVIHAKSCGILDDTGHWVCRLAVESDPIL